MINGSYTTGAGASSSHAQTAPAIATIAQLQALTYVHCECAIKRLNRPTAASLDNWMYLNSHELMNNDVE